MAFSQAQAATASTGDFVRGRRIDQRIRRVFVKLSWTVVRAVLRCRYRVVVEGLPERDSLTGPTLILPNHPAYIDPALVLSFLGLKQTVRPVVYVDTYRHLALRRWMQLIDALEIPDLRRQRRQGQLQVTAAINEIIAGMDRGESFLLYPSGRLQRGRFEIIGSARACFDVLQGVQEVNLLLVRTRGVWGSMFSCAATGDVPHLSACLRRAMIWLCLGLGAGMPKRRITLSCRLVPASELASMNRVALNQWLEAWYNADGGETPRFVPYHVWWGPQTSSFERIAEATCESSAPQVNATTPLTLGWRSRAVRAGRLWRSAAGRQVSRIRLASQRMRRRR